MRLRAGARSRPRHVQCTWGARRRATAESCRLPPQGRVDRCYWGDTTVQVAIPPTASEFRGGITGVTLRPVSGADFVSLITDATEHLLHGSEGSSVIEVVTLFVEYKHVCTKRLFAVSFLCLVCILVVLSIIRCPFEGHLDVGLAKIPTPCVRWKCEHFLPLFQGRWISLIRQDLLIHPSNCLYVQTHIHTRTQTRWSCMRWSPGSTIREN